MQTTFMRGFLTNKREQNNRTTGRSRVHRVLLLLPPLPLLFLLLLLEEIRACLYADMNDPINQDTLMMSGKEGRMRE